MLTLLHQTHHHTGQQRKNAQPDQHHLKVLVYLRGEGVHRLAHLLQVLDGLFMIHGIALCVQFLNDRGEHHEIGWLQMLGTDGEDVLHGHHFLLDGGLLLWRQGEVLFQRLVHHVEEGCLRLGGLLAQQQLYQLHRRAANLLVGNGLGNAFEICRKQVGAG